MIRSTLSTALVAAVALAGCSVSQTASQSEVEQVIKDKLAEQVGRAPEQVRCPDELDGKVGTTMTCTLTDGGESLPVYVTVTGAENSKVQFDILVGTK